jgi:hypothetical protein
MEQSRKFPETAAIGVDLCAANLREASRKAGRNARFLAADACTLPEEVLALADHINIAFPWGRYLREILDAEGAFPSRLVHGMRPGSTLSILINAEASQSCDVELPDARAHIVRALAAGSDTRSMVTTLDAPELKSWPSTWARRLAFGRNPHAIAISTSVLSEPMRPIDDFTRIRTLYHPGLCPVAALQE